MVRPRKHPKIEQLHGLTEDPDLEVQNAIEEVEFEDEIDIYLKTGKIQITKLLFSMQEENFHVHREKRKFRL